jgi:tRNA-specific 2-thiouridylase
MGLKTYDKEDSQEICFVPGNDYTAFLKSHLGEKDFHPGGIYFKDGTRMGDHEGIEFYTVGQRKGLGGGHGRPVYVIDIDPARSASSSAITTTSSATTATSPRRTGATPG